MPHGLGDVVSAVDGDRRTLLPDTGVDSPEGWGSLLQMSADVAAGGVTTSSRWSWVPGS